MQTIVDYIILVEESEYKLTTSVKEKIVEGYQPYGEMIAKGEYQHATFIQVVVKYHGVAIITKG